MLTGDGCARARMTTIWTGFAAPSHKSAPSVARASRKWWKKRSTVPRPVAPAKAAGESGLTASAPFFDYFWWWWRQSRAIPSLHPFSRFQGKEQRFLHVRRLSSPIKAWISRIQSSYQPSIEFNLAGNETGTVGGNSLLRPKTWLGQRLPPPAPHDSSIAAVVGVRSPDRSCRSRRTRWAGHGP